MSHYNVKELAASSNNGVSEVILLKRQDTFSKSLSVKVITIESNRTIVPEQVVGEYFYFVLSGKGSLAAEQLKGYWNWPLNCESAFWIPLLTNFSIKSVGDTPLRIMEFCFGYAKNKDSYEIKSQLIISVVNRLQQPIEFFNTWLMYNLFTSKPEAKKLYFSSYDIVHPNGFLPRHFPNLNCEEIQYVISGHGKMSVGDTIYEVQPGSLVYVPPKTFHDIKNTNDNEPMELLICESFSHSI